jgi:transposase
LKRALYGARSERFEDDAAQLALELDDLSAAPAESEAGPAQPSRDRSARRGRAARNIGSLPKHLPREEIVIEPAIDACPCCHGKLHRIGEDVSEMLDIVPAIIRVKRIRRPRYGCRACESAVVQAPAPPRPVEGGLPTTTVLAHVAVSKFAWHLPLHRQAQMLAGHGIALDRSTLVHWIGRAAWWLKPLHDLLIETVMSAPKVFCDDTPWPVLDRTRRRTRIARLWCYAVDDRRWQGPTPAAVVYRYAEDRRGRHIRKHLEGFRGVLQVDGYSGYDELARPERRGGAITLAYSAEQRVAVRQSETKPLMAAFWSWLMERLAEISAKSSLAKAIRYTLNHWEGLTLFLADGRIEVDNNTVERSIRPIPLGRKNALFAGSHTGGERWAILASLINTAKLHALDPQTWLADVLDEIVSGRTKANALTDLLPWNWRPASSAGISLGPAAETA